MALVISILNALAAIPSILGYVEKFAAAVVTWWSGRQTSETLSQIADAAALASRAQTDEDRFKAAEAWQRALSRDRFIN